MTEPYSYFGKIEAYELDEYQQLIQSGQCSSETKPAQQVNKVVASVPSADTVSLAEIRRRDKAETEAARDEAHLKRFRIVNYTSEDSEVTQSQHKLRTYYCAVCGSHVLTTSADLLELPCRTTDAAIAFPSSDYFHKTYMKKLDCVHLNRGNGVECQYRYGCQDCGYPLLYSPTEDPLDSKFSYFYNDGLVAEQSMAAALEPLAA